MISSILFSLKDCGDFELKLLYGKTFRKLNIVLDLIPLRKCFFLVTLTHGNFFWLLEIKLRTISSGRSIFKIVVSGVTTGPLEVPL